MSTTNNRYSGLILAALCCLLSRGGAQTTMTYAPTMEIFPNPERGFYTHREVQAEGSGLTLSDMNTVRGKNQSLILRLYYLKKFRTAALSTAQLNLMQRDFDVMRQAGVKCVLRFAYSSYETDPDAPLTTIYQHLDQMKSLLELNRDVIAVVQAGFIGAWGEWYYSTNKLNTTEGRRSVLLKTLEVLPANWMVQVRTPNYKMDIFQRTDPLTIDSAFGPGYYARTGHHNDCFLASMDDYGTYQDTTADKQWLAIDSRFVPMGGETCALSAFSGWSNARAELARMHWSYLNADYNTSVLNAWGTAALDSVKRQLGYRFELLRGTFQDSVRPGNGYTLNIRLLNRGYASPFNVHRAYVLLRNIKDSAVYCAQPVCDPRYWFAGDTSVIALNAKIPAAMPEGTYEVLLHLADASAALRLRPEYSIRLANAGVWESKTGYNKLLASLTVSAGAVPTPVTDTLTFRSLAESMSSIEPVSRRPERFKLLGSYPNPFNSTMRIAYELRQPSPVSLKVFNIVGQEVASLDHGENSSGRHSLFFNAGGLASGSYYYVLAAGDLSAVGRFMLVK